MNIYLVGGAVRDTLLGLKIKDRDWVVVGATPQQLLDLGYQQAGRDFPVFLHPKTHEEYALARTERKHGHGYGGFSTYFSPDVTLEQDLQRRDLTINAMAQDARGKIIDPYRGKHDLEQRILRHISDAFSEDPLRVLRVARFAARLAPLDFQIAAETLELMQTISQSGELDYLTCERIWQETQQALCTTQPAHFFQVLRHCGALAKLFPEINFLFSIPYPLPSVAENYGEYALLCLQAAVQFHAPAEVRLAVICQALHNHASKLTDSLDTLEQMAERLKWPNLYRDTAKIVLNSAHLLLSDKPANPTDIINIFDNIDAWRKPERLTLLILSCQACDLVRSNGQTFPRFNGEQLERAFQQASSVPVAPIIAAGAKGRLIQEELRHQRIAAISSGNT